MTHTNLPAIQDQIDAVQRHKQNQDLVFVTEDDLGKHTMFMPEIVVVHATPEDFHNISGKMMPKRHYVDRCAEASGVTFLEQNCGTRTEKVDGHEVYVGYAQAKKRMPDGTWRTSSVAEYEFDPKKRADEDILRDTKGKYNTEKDKKLLLLTYQKFGRQRANTGARARAIRELTGMPTAFEQRDIQKAMVFYRIAVNTDELLASPQGQRAALGLVTGAVKDIYGPTAAPPDDDESRRIEAPAEEEEENLPPFGMPPEKSPEQQEIEASLEELRQLSEIPYLHKDAKALSGDILAQENPNLDAVNGAIDRINLWLSLPDVVQKYGKYEGGQS